MFDFSACVAEYYLLLTNHSASKPESGKKTKLIISIENSMVGVSGGSTGIP